MDSPLPGFHLTERQSGMAKNSSSNSILESSVHALAEALRAGNAEAAPDGAGYVAAIEHNLLPGVRLDQFEDDLRAGDGNELETKFRAAHSSSALCVNAFAPFRDRPGDLVLAGIGGLHDLAFERKCPTGLRGRRSPNLDFLAEGPAHVVAVESKCTEYLRPHEAAFSPAYREQIRDARRDRPWFAEMLRLMDDPRHYTFLDVAQLVKHAFGIERTFPEKDVTLLYLFWEPSNADTFSPFQQHRAEIEELVSRVHTGPLGFRAMSYGELWDSWESNNAPGWLINHIAALRKRYLVCL